MRFEDNLVSAPHLIPRKKFVQPSVPGCLLVNMVISPPNQADAAMKDPGSARLLLQVLRCSVGSAQAHGRKTSGCCMTLEGPLHYSPLQGRSGAY